MLSAATTTHTEPDQTEAQDALCISALGKFLFLFPFFTDHIVYRYIGYHQHKHKTAALWCTGRHNDK